MNSPVSKYDLRIGNQVRDNFGQLFNIEEIRTNIIVGTMMIRINEDNGGQVAPLPATFISPNSLYGIELCHEAFIQLGFKFVQHENMYDTYFFDRGEEKDTLIITFENHSNRYLYHNGQTIFHIQYVHELQNLVYLLSKEDFLLLTPNKNIMS